ncbi:MAG: hypothetical protein LBE49_00130 [Deltaproteobacteria bacterium]|jgi:hypothetical protein|nr:hypothetical protein [Deltaproteobacteria bacterium]
MAYKGKSSEGGGASRKRGAREALKRGERSADTIASREPFWRRRSRKGPPKGADGPKSGPDKGFKPEETENKLESVPPKYRLRRLPKGLFAPLAACVLALVLGFLLMTYLAMRHNQLGREVSRLNNQKVALADLNRRLKADMDMLTVMEDLELVARERLGLVSPAQGQIEIIE